MFTQPLMYKKIRGHKNAHQRYVEQLLAEGSADQATVGAGRGWAAGGGEALRAGGPESWRP
jgi:2-oxoglutarate dehydrogenase complex dehydrogenase (E1) component-like enzyme